MTSHAALLRALPGHGFAPPAADAGALLPADPAGDFARRVGAFAAEFWLLPPDARQTGWGALTVGAVGPAAARLEELWPGLAVVPVVPFDADAAEVTRLVLELFVLPPAARAARRVAWLDERADDLPRWREAGHAVMDADRPLSRLEPRLFRRLLGRAEAVRVAAATPAAIRKHARDREKRRERKEGGERREGWLWLAAALVIVVSVGAAWLTTSGSPRPTQRSLFSLPKIPPAQRPGPFTKPMTVTYSKDEVIAFRVYEDGGRVGAAPPRYSDWVFHGRPAAGVEVTP